MSKNKHKPRAVTWVIWNFPSHILSGELYAGAEGQLVRCTKCCSQKILCKLWFISVFWWSLILFVLTLCLYRVTSSSSSTSHFVLVYFFFLWLIPFGCARFSLVGARCWVSSQNTSFLGCQQLMNEFLEDSDKEMQPGFRNTWFIYIDHRPTSETA